ncbi:stabilizer of axonemal microtubules 2-like [Pipistrellus kuhlii]|uniref:stabilizer of axonemal microtubules 2-like n=1 Tax=Pipistrellus kuhlii TaxID=59472 RepID=UPI00174F4FB2|nr:stabilizer of axonemal microtubules 2-like [Pipistrellus kuhlii]
MRSWCLCQICTCGRHRCPHGTTRIYENSGAFCPTTTEYLESYPTYGNVPPAQSLKPKPDAPEDRGQMEGITTFKSDYRPHEIVQQPRHLPEEYKPRSGDIDLHTTYRRDFNPYPAQPAAAVRPPERRQVQKGKLDTIPTYKDDYRAWELQKSRLYKPERAYQPPTVKFGNPTTFQEDFVPRAAPGPRQSFRPAAPAPGPAAAAPFLGLTSHRLDFVPHALGPRPAPARPRPARRPSPQPFRDQTSYSADFVPKKQEVCPASYLSPPGYVFQTANSRGHRFFRKVAPASSSRQAS